MVQINKRLSKVCEYLNHEYLADIGSDHAYLPIYAIQNNLIKKAIAGEVVKGPFEAAVKNVKSYDLQNQIQVKLGNGLEVVNQEVDVITICGMGGPLIAQILTEGKDKLKHYPDLCLQSNIHSQPIRQILQNLGYNITNEHLIKEKKHIYEIIIASKGKMELTEDEFKFGPKLLQQKDDLFFEKWERELKSLKNIEKQVSLNGNKKRLNEILYLIQQIEEVLKC